MFNMNVVKRLVIAPICIFTLATQMCYAEGKSSNINKYVLDSSGSALQVIQLDRKTAEHALTVRLSSPITEKEIPSLRFDFYRSKKDYETESRRSQRQITIWINDPKCTGEYGSEMVYRPSKKKEFFHKYKEKTPWPENIRISVVKLGYKKYSVRINDELIDVKTSELLGYLRVTVSQGEAVIEYEKIKGE